MIWDYHQGDGARGPFGYVDGWFVDWFLDSDGNLAFTLTRDAEDRDEPESSEDEAEQFVREWLDRELTQEYSRAVETLARHYRAHVRSR
jgi:hypothetical protein